MSEFPGESEMGGAVQPEVAGSDGNSSPPLVITRTIQQTDNKNKKTSSVLLNRLNNSGPSSPSVVSLPSGSASPVSPGSLIYSNHPAAGAGQSRTELSSSVSSSVKRSQVFIFINLKRKKDFFFSW